MRLEDTAQSCKGEFRIDVFRNGERVTTFADHNLVVEAGRVRLAELAAGVSTACITQIGVGEGDTTEADTDTELTNQALFPLDKASVIGRDARFDFSIDNTQGNGLKIHEFGLFCADGTMFSHRVRSGVIEKAEDISIKGYWILHF
nr:MAG TPA: tail-collar fiber protein [Caudoviricetes sp.]